MTVALTFPDNHLKLQLTEGSDIFKLKNFLYKLENKFRSKECNGGVKYDDLTNIFRSTLDNHAPLKQK